MTTLRKHIKGKSVCLVGRAEYIGSMAQGDLIDSHDVVIRVHNNLPWPAGTGDIRIDNDESFVPTEFHAAVGKKTTGFAPTNAPLWPMAYVHEIGPQLIERDCEYLIQHKPYNLLPPENLAKIDFIRSKYMPVYMVPDARLYRLIRAFDYSMPMPGTILIDYILSLKPQSLYCTGFTCYLDTGEEWLKSEVKIFRDHKPLYDLRHLRDLWRSDTHMTIDKEMEGYCDSI